MNSMIGKITGGSIASLTATLSEMTDLGSFVVIRDGARKFWGTIVELSHPQVPAELASMSINTSRFQPEAAINLKRMSSGNGGYIHLFILLVSCFRVGKNVSSDSAIGYSLSFWSLVNTRI